MFDNALTTTSTTADILYCSYMRKNVKWFSLCSALLFGSFYQQQRELPIAATHNISILSLNVCALLHHVVHGVVSHHLKVTYFHTLLQEFFSVPRLSCLPYFTLIYLRNENRNDLHSGASREGVSRRCDDFLWTCSKTLFFSICFSTSLEIPVEFKRERPATTTPVMWSVWEMDLVLTRQFQNGKREPR